MVGLGLYKYSITFRWKHSVTNGMSIHQSSHNLWLAVEEQNVCPAAQMCMSPQPQVLAMLLCTYFSQPFACKRLTIAPLHYLPALASLLNITVPNISWEKQFVDVPYISNVHCPLVAKCFYMKLYLCSHQAMTLLLSLLTRLFTMNSIIGHT